MKNQSNNRNSVNGIVLNDDQVKNFINLLELQMRFEVAIQKALREQYALCDQDQANEVAMNEFVAYYKPHLDKVREVINDRLNDHMHNAIMDEVL